MRSQIEITNKIRQLETLLGMSGTIYPTFDALRIKLIQEQLMILKWVNENE